MSEVLLKIVGILAMVALVLIIELACIKIGWEMFAVPVLHLAELTWEQAIGLAILASCLRGSSGQLGSLTSKKE